jgi:8-oxo-dGTP pyrophosphatase MutT (NUDIX family)
LSKNPPPDSSPLFISATGKIQGADAVAALLLLEDGRYVMQLRDAMPGIFYPDHWGCFGGAVDGGETAEHALRRELREELEFSASDMRFFTRFDFDFAPLGQQRVYRIYYEVPVSRSAFSTLVLHEGAEFRAFSAAELLTLSRVTPYDAFAVWLHCRRERFQP